MHFALELEDKAVEVGLQEVSSGIAGTFFSNVSSNIDDMINICDVECVQYAKWTICRLAT